jgi:hypothetical protein
MNIKKLYEKTQWQKLNEADFKTRVIDYIVEQAEKIDKINSIIIQLDEQITELRRAIGANVAYNKIRVKKLSEQRNNFNEFKTEQKRNSGSIS